MHVATDWTIPFISRQNLLCQLSCRHHQVNAKPPNSRSDLGQRHNLRPIVNTTLFLSLITQNVVPMWFNAWPASQTVSQH